MASGNRKTQKQTGESEFQNWQCRISVNNVDCAFLSLFYLAELQFELKNNKKTPTL